MDTYTTIVKFFQEGGIFMYPIALVAALGAAVAIERWLHLWRTESANRRMWDERVAVHRADRTGFYAVEGFRRGEDVLGPIEAGEIGDREAGVEEDVAQVDEIELAGPGGGRETFLEGGERLGRHARDRHPGQLLEPRGLPRERVELAVGGEDAERLPHSATQFRRE